jgi:hypothetical protein
MSHGNTMPPGEALALAAAAVGSTVDGCEDVQASMNIDEGSFVSTTVVWRRKDGSVLAEATVLASGEVQP